MAGAGRTLRLLTLPLRLAVAIWRLTVALGVGVVHFGVNLIAAAFGMVVMLFVGFCLARALLHPLFPP